MSEVRPVRLHLTNIAGLGASNLVKSLLPALERAPGYRIETMYLPDWGDLANHVPAPGRTSSSRYVRRSANSLSRFLECTVFARRFEGDTPLLVLGDLPLRCRCRQTVFVQTPLFTRTSRSVGGSGRLKYHISRWLFGFNAGRVSTFIVQTEAMKASLVATFPQIADRVHVVHSPVPSWLLDRPVKRTGRRDPSSRLELFYPVAAYPHKNHRLLKDIDASEAASWPVADLALTISVARNPNPAIPWVSCVGRLDSAELIACYERVDALLFLSRAESLGFPLLEAMWIGLPIVCADLPYARVLCGDGAIYFDPNSVDSLRRAVTELRDRLDAGWWPDWTGQLAGMPRSWDDVASSMLALSTDSFADR